MDSHRKPFKGYRRDNIVTYNGSYSVVAFTIFVIPYYLKQLQSIQFYTWNIL